MFPLIYNVRCLKSQEPTRFKLHVFYNTCCTRSHLRSKHFLSRCMFFPLKVYPLVPEFSDPCRPSEGLVIIMTCINCCTMFILDSLKPLYATTTDYKWSNQRCDWFSAWKLHVNGADWIETWSGAVLFLEHSSRGEETRSTLSYNLIVQRGDRDAAGHTTNTRRSWRPTAMWLDLAAFLIMLENVREQTLYCCSESTYQQIVSRDLFIYLGIIRIQIVISLRF